MNRSRVVLLLLSAILVLAAGYLGYVISPISSSVSPVNVTIPKGASTRQVAELLAQAGVIRWPTLFSSLAFIAGERRNLKSGEYRLSAAMSPWDVMKKLTRGEVLLHRITLPEGITLCEVVDRLVECGFGTRDEFLRLALDGEFVRSMDIEAPSLEGYLFPETYYFSSQEGVKKILRTMVEAFKRSFTPEDRSRAAELGMTVHQVVTLASIIEKETSRAEERPIVSAIFHNRLRRAMPLQSDPTVIYALPYFNGNLRRPDLSFDSPYNTYLYTGLPPGPIANPGRASIQAALNPAQVDFLYFVSKNDGSHYFSSTLAEHNRAVRLYQGGSKKASE